MSRNGIIWEVWQAFVMFRHRWLLGAPSNSQCSPIHTMERLLIDSKPFRGELCELFK